MGKMLFWITLLCLFLTSRLENTLKLDSQQPDQYRSLISGVCPHYSEHALNVHFVPHTHDDVGWLETVDRYYVTRVKNILDTTIDVLLNNDTYRFTYVEMAYFHMWWNKQSPELRARVHQELVCGGRLQFALGGWSMSDEATVYYADEIDQLTKGRAFLYEQFGQCALPRVAWQIDTFGHARDRAQLFIQAGYDAVFFPRIEFHEKLERRKGRSLQFLWDTHAVPSTLPQNLFTHIFYDTYCYPPEVCIDADCTVRKRNMNNAAESLLNEIELWAQAYRVSHILVPMGCDFSYRLANVNFDTTDELMQILNGTEVLNRTLNVVYSTPACYIYAIHQEINNAQLALPRREGDFFPYADRPNNYWTGFYTSRPSLKALVRQQSLLLTVVEQLNVFNPSIDNVQIIDQLRQELGILQHHDAVTGTEKQHVVEDYKNRLCTAGYPCEILVSRAIANLSGGFITRSVFCNLRNISLCEETTENSQWTWESNGFLIVIYNPLGWEHTEPYWLRIPVCVPTSATQVTVVDLDDQKRPAVTYQLAHITDRTWFIPERQQIQSAANMELIFSPTYGGYTLPAVGYMTFHVSMQQGDAQGTLVGTILKRSSPNFVKSKDNFMEYALTHSTDEILVLTNHVATRTRFRLSVKMLVYLASDELNHVSGAYVFRPTPTSGAVEFHNPHMTFTHGACFQEVTASYALWATLIVRLYADGQLEVEWTVGPIPDSSTKSGHEVIVRYTVQGVEQIKPATPGEFFTDSAGRRLIRRIRKSKLSNQTEPSEISGNYYPVINRITLKGAKPSASRRAKKTGDLPPLGFAVYTDRPQGGTSLQDGQLELMVHRRLQRDEHLGVQEKLKEDGVDGLGKSDYAGLGIQIKCTRVQFAGMNCT
ncbi:Alpha-mannosidase [Paragonimus heterotremus]|uniref:Alpha-mannosidase n=1 Tax=Paragonimus heterotremus TaxID=100268 RepID=A0A8J4SNC8_9TREM|nr:Alpha-mannosidase [Paragonimus heterotremus]